MKKYEGRLIGILGTVILHLIAGIIFMSFQLTSLQGDNSDEFVVEFAPAEETPETEKLIELPVTSLEKVLQGDEEMLNIARNLSNKAEVKINPEDYIDMVKEELIKSGKLGTNNYIDEKKNPDRTNEDEKLALENQEEVSENKPDQSQEMAANYKGLTRIYYDLVGRTHTRLPIPIYKCQGAGKVVLSIYVNQRGIVEKALVIEKESTTSDPCLIETAVTTALISRFNSDNNAPKIQTGTLSYHFVSQ
jgi:hypothetical protein